MIVIVWVSFTRVIIYNIEGCNEYSDISRDTSVNDTNSMNTLTLE